MKQLFVTVSTAMKSEEITARLNDPIQNGFSFVRIVQEGKASESGVIKSIYLFEKTNLHEAV